MRKDLIEKIPGAAPKSMGMIQNVRHFIHSLRERSLLDWCEAPTIQYLTPSQSTLTYCNASKQGSFLRRASWFPQA